MANHKSALKRHRQSVKRRLRNREVKSVIKTVIRSVNDSIAASSAEDAEKALKAAIPAIDRAAVKGTIHWKTAARKVSRLTRRVNAFVNSTKTAASS